MSERDAMPPLDRCGIYCESCGDEEAALRECTDCERLFCAGCLLVLQCRECRRAEARTAQARERVHVTWPRRVRAAREISGALYVLLLGPALLCVAALVGGR